MLSYIYYRRKKYVPRNLIKVLKFGTKVLDMSGIPYWLYHGTLLGVIRDRAIIVGDGDVDCCILERDVGKLMNNVNYCRENGYELTRIGAGKRFIEGGIPIGEDFCRIKDTRTGLHLDIGLAVETNGCISDPCVAIPNTLRQTWTYDTIFPLKKISIFGSEFTIPNNPDAVNFAQYNSDCYDIRKGSSESLAAENKHNQHTLNMIKHFSR